MERSDYMRFDRLCSHWSVFPNNAARRAAGPQEDTRTNKRSILPSYSAFARRSSTTSHALAQHVVQ
jgi:hypothetical protein